MVDTFTDFAPTLYHAIDGGDAPLQVNHQQSKIFTPIFDPFEHDLYLEQLFLEQLFLELFLEQLFLELFLEQLLLLEQLLREHLEPHLLLCLLPLQSS